MIYVSCFGQAGGILKMISILVCLSYNFCDFRHQKVLIKLINNGSKHPLYHRVDLLRREADPKPGEIAQKGLKQKCEVLRLDPQNPLHLNTAAQAFVIL